jgi:hypothetical protein
MPHVRERARRYRRCRARSLAGGLLLACIGLPIRGQTLGWERTAEMSGNAWYGAAHARVLAGELGVARTDSTLSTHADLRVGYADDRTDDGLRRVTARDIRASLSFDYRPFARYSPFAFSSVESSLQQRVARRVNVGLGAKLTILRKARDDVSASLALLDERTRALTPPDSARPIAVRTRWSLRVRYRRQLTSNLFFSHVTFYQPAVGALEDRYTVEATTAVEAAVTSLLALTSTLRHRYDNEARTRGADSNTDGQLLLGVRARF